MSEKKGFTHPTLEAMGIKRLRLPSRNWSIFLGTVGLLVGGAIYDKQEQKKVRKKWVEMAQKYGDAKISANEVPRKLTVFIAPPPDDYLEESHKLFRRYVKPILNAAGIDLEVCVSSKQGRIRNQVAKDIRELRRKVEQMETEAEAQKTSALSLPYEIYGKLKYLFMSKSERDKLWEEKTLIENQEKLKNMKNVLGVFYNDTDKEMLPQMKYLDSEKTKLNEIGGVLCFGRGVYKEYLTGVHEGLLGPLARPARVMVEQAEYKHAKLLEEEEKKDEKDRVEVKSVEELTQELENNEAEVDEDGPALGSYILPDEYKESKFAPELQKFVAPDGKLKKLPTDDGVTPYFQQPIMAMKVPNLIGFTTIPTRIYRYYNRRHLADEYGKLAMGIVENLTREFKDQDVDLCIDEEQEWPKRWVERGKSKNSDWVREMKLDSRVTKNLWVFEKYEPEDPNN